MRHLLIGLLTLININTLCGQVFYKSSDDSFRTHYYLAIDDKSVTLYGWELTLEKDTIYFTANGQPETIKSVQNENISITFEKFRFSKTRPTEKDLKTFNPDKSDLLETFWLHRHILILERNEKTVNALMTKDIYPGSRADKFTFTKIK